VRREDVAAHVGLWVLGRSSCGRCGKGGREESEESEDPQESEDHFELGLIWVVCQFTSSKEGVRFAM